MSTTAVVILNYNNWQDTINCIESVEKYNTYPIKYIVVDNCSTNDSVEQLNHYLSETFTDYKIIEEGHLLKKLPFLTFVKTSENYGYAGGNNVALKLAEQDDEINHILILNNDVLFIEDIIGGLIKNITEDTGIISPILYKRDGLTLDMNCARRNVSIQNTIKEYLCWCIGLKYSNKSKYILSLDKNLPLNKIEIELPSGSCMLISKDVFKSINYFDPHTFLYWEENILHRKLQKIHKCSYLMPNYRCIHLGASSSSSTSSLLLLKANYSSSVYYYEHYDQCNLCSKILLKFVCQVYLFLITISKLLRRKI